MRTNAKYLGDRGFFSEITRLSLRIAAHKVIGFKLTANLVPINTWHWHFFSYEYEHGQKNSIYMDKGFAYSVVWNTFQTLSKSVSINLSLWSRVWINCSVVLSIVALLTKATGPGSSSISSSLLWSCRTNAGPSPPPNTSSSCTTHHITAKLTENSNHQNKQECLPTSDSVA